MKRAGSKTRLVGRILPHIAAVPHVTYVEPFCGTCAVLLAKPRSKGEVVNDLDGVLVNALRQVKHHLPAVMEELRLVPNSREELIARRSYPGLTEIQRAASYLYLNNISFAGDCRSYGVNRRNGGGAHTPATRLVKQCTGLAARLDGVSVECLPWQRCMELYDTLETLFFIDPPYLGCDVIHYATWTESDAQELRSVLRSIRGRWIVTLNDTPAVREIFAGCHFHLMARAKHLNGTKTGSRSVYRELIITPN